MDAQHFAQTLQNIFGSLVTHNDDNAMDDHDMPPLEPIVPTVRSNTRSTTAQSTTEAPGTSLDDVRVQSAQSTSTARNDIDSADDDDDSMPELQSVSNSSDSENSDDDDESDRDANEVEMQTVHDDDNDSSWTDEDEGMPALEPINGSLAPTAQRRTNRRARVEDDQDDERDRRHPSQRVADTMSINEPPPSNASSTGTATPVPPTMNFPPQPRQNQFGPPPLPTNIFTPRPLPPLPPHMLFRIPLGRFRAPNQNARNNNANNNAPNPPNDNPNFNDGQPIFGGFAIAIDNNGMPILHTHHHGPPNPNGNGNPNGGPGQNIPGVGHFVGNNLFPQDFAALFNFVGNAVGVNGFGFGEREQEDPERAKRLVDGLEEVPVGLVRRLGRVGGGGLEGEEGASGGDGGCAICWDTLLGGGDGWGNKENEKKEESASVEAATTVATETGTNAQPSIEPSMSDDTIVESSSSSDAASSLKEPVADAENETSKSEPAYPKIVALPCAHVFHASCLIPWFSRPRQTTCPTCRFNIDPENLTYVRRRRAPAAGNNNNNTNATGAAQAQTQTQAPGPPLPSQGEVDPQQTTQPGPTPPVVVIQMPAAENVVPSPTAGTGDGGAANNLGGAPPMNGFPPIFVNPHQVIQASADILASMRADLVAVLASAQSAPANPPLPGDPNAITGSDPRLVNAEADIRRVEQWLARLGSVGGLGLNADVNAGAGVPIMVNNGADGKTPFIAR